MPKHVLEKYVANGTFNSTYGVNWKPQDIVGSGPFVIQEYEPAQYVLLARNPYFFEVDSNGTRLPYVDNVIYDIVPDWNAMSLRMLHGEDDVDDAVRPDEYDTFKAAEPGGKIKLLEPGPGADDGFVMFNQNTNVDKSGKPLVDPIKLKWFRNTKFRQAVAYAIDREAIIKTVFSGTLRTGIWFRNAGQQKMV